MPCFQWPCAIGFMNTTYNRCKGKVLRIRKSQRIIFDQVTNLRFLTLGIPISRDSLLKWALSISFLVGEVMHWMVKLLASRIATPSKLRMKWIPVSHRLTILQSPAYKVSMSLFCPTVIIATTRKVRLRMKMVPRYMPRLLLPHANQRHSCGLLLGYVLAIVHRLALRRWSFWIVCWFIIESTLSSFWTNVSIPKFLHVY